MSFEKRATDFYTQIGYEPHQAAALAGNALAESGGDPTIRGDSGAAFGLFQWHPDRQDRLRDFATSRGLDMNAENTQLAFMDYELQTTESRAGAQLRNARTPEEANAAVLASLRPRGYSAANPQAANNWAGRLKNTQLAMAGGPEQIIGTLPSADLERSYLAYRQLAANQGPVAQLIAARAAQAQVPGAPPSPVPGRPQDWADWGLSVGGSIARGAWAVTKDIGQGAIEAPRAIVRGIVGAPAEVLSAGNDLANWLNANVADLTVPGPNLLGLSAKGLGAARDLLNAPESNTGKMVEFTSQWLTSSAMAGNVARALGVPANAYTKVIKDFAAGATGMDPHSPRLSTMVDGWAPNPVTDFLKAKEDDPALLARLKSGLEVAGIGAATDGVIAGFKYLRSLYQASKAAPAAETAAQAAPAAPGAAPAPARDFAPVGNPVAPPLEIAPDTAAKAERFLAGTTPDSPVKLNLARIGGPEDVRAAIGRISQELPEVQIRTHEQVIQAARDLALTPEELLRMRGGGALNDAQITAARMMLRSAGGQLMDLAQKAAGADASAVDMAAFQKAYALTYGIAQQVKGSGTEIARALSAHRIMSASEPDALKAIQELLAQSGGADATREMAAKIAALGDPGKVAQFVQGAARATTRSQIMFVYQNILTSSPTSHLANIAGNTTSTLLSIPERFVAGQVGNGVVPGEATAQLFGTLQGVRDAMRAAWRALKTGEQSFGAAKEVLEPGIGQAIGPAPAVEAGGLSGFADYAKTLLPTRALGAEDEFFKWINYRGEAAALAFRQASREGLSGVERASRVGEILNSLPDDIHAAAVQAAKVRTFNQPLSPRMERLAGFIRDVNFEVRPGVEIPVGSMIVPFTRTPTNIFKWTFERAGPLALISRDVRADLAAGGARADMALAKMTTGSLIAAAGVDAALSGQISGGGPRDPELKAALLRTGWQPYSVKFGNRWYGYNRLDTPGQLLGIAADSVDLLAWASDHDRGYMAQMLGFAFANAVLSKTYMTGLAGLLNAVSDPQRYGENFLQREAGSIVPGGVAAVERVMDPTVRAAYSELDAIRARTPGLSAAMPPRRDLWGQPIKVEGAWMPGLDPRYGQLVSPIAVSADKQSPIDNEIVRLHMKVQGIPQSVDFPGGVSLQLKPLEYDRLLELAGNAFKDQRGMGAKDALDALVTGKAPQSDLYRSVSDDAKALMIRAAIQAYRSGAKAQLLKEFPELAATVTQMQANRATSLRERQ